MTPVDQEFLHDPKNNVWGDCQRAVIASLLDLPISEVPHFNDIAKGESYEFYEEIQKFLKPLGYAWLVVHGAATHLVYGTDDPVYHEISGPSPRGNGLHAVVGKDRQIVHDPHPDKTGLLGDQSQWTYGYLIKL